MSALVHQQRSSAQDAEEFPSRKHENTKTRKSFPGFLFVFSQFRVLVTAFGCGYAGLGALWYSL